jgi:hypothetical protein
MIKITELYAAGDVLEREYDISSHWPHRKLMREKTLASVQESRTFGNCKKM